LSDVTPSNARLLKGIMVIAAIVKKKHVMRDMLSIISIHSNCNFGKIAYIVI